MNLDIGCVTMSCEITVPWTKKLATDPEQFDSLNSVAKTLLKKCGIVYDDFNVEVVAETSAWYRDKNQVRITYSKRLTIHFHSEEDMLMFIFKFGRDTQFLDKAEEQEKLVTIELMRLLSDIG